ncbi:MAG: hypothetical protein ACO39X_03660, partial [Candidatus Nanopelagicaceae bacterium]
SLQGPALSTVGRSETFTATITPAREKGTIVLEQLDRKSGKYLEVARGKIDGSGSVSLPATMSEGFLSFRARLQAKGESAASPTALVSSTQWVTVLR